MTILPDTDAYSAWKRGHPRMLTLMRGASRIVVSTAVAGELLAGFRRGNRLERNRREFDELLVHPCTTVQPVTMQTAERYAAISVALRAQGRPIPTNDVWIAAHAIECDADLISFDQHFRGIDGLRWIDLGK